MQELNPLSDVKKNIEWEINICSTLAPKLSLIGGKPDHDWCINEILFPMSKMLDGKRNIRLTSAPNTIVAVFISPNVELPLWHLFFFSNFFFFFFFFCRCQKLGVRFIHGCGLYNVNYGMHYFLWGAPGGTCPLHVDPPPQYLCSLGCYGILSLM